MKPPLQMRMAPFEPSTLTFETPCFQSTVYPITRLELLVLNVELMEVVHCAKLSGFDSSGRDASPNGTWGLCIVGRKLDLAVRIMHK